MRPTVLLSLVATLFLLLAVTYSLVIPPFEATDEVSHFQYSQFLKEHRRLPRQSHQREQLENVVAHNPPLYYLAVLAVVWAVDASDLAQVAPLNPDFLWGDLNAGGPFVHRHDPVGERFPWSGAILALHLARLVSVVAGVFTVLGAARIGQRLLGPPGGVVVAALTAFLPSFMFTSATVHNDAFVTLFSVWALERLLAISEEGASWRRWLVTGVLLAAAGLSKLAGFLLVPLLVPAALAATRRQGRRPAFTGATLALATVLVLATPWFAWNLANYGEPTGYLLFSTNPLFPIREAPLPLPAILPEVGPRSLLFHTFVLAFGYQDRLGPSWLYDAARFLVVIGVAGLLLRLGREPASSLRALTRPPVVIALLALVLFVVSLGRYVQTFLSGGHGRYLFPVLPILATGLVAGWSAWLPRSARPAALALAAAALAALAVATPFLIIAPGYALTGEVTGARREELARRPPLATFDQQIALLEAEVRPTVARPGEEVRVRLVWQALTPVLRSYQVFVQLVGPAGGAGGVNRAPGNGLAATSRWTPGLIVEDELVLVVERTARPGRYEVWTGFFQRESGARLPVSSGPDRGGTTVIGQVKVPPPPPEAPPVALPFVYAGQLALEGRSEVPPVVPGGRLPLVLFWQALAQPREDYSLSLQLLSSQGVVAQLDGPLGGALPTSAWEAGERLATHHELPLPPTLPPGRYDLITVVYRLADGSRLSAGGTTAPVIASVEVGRMR
ncbi:MAG: hypothetical protein KatS3mg061_3106 [Dehalococcoidia bacterium]|nr:MAG: hypothetical protein KatS3mg061_3106 [Dehalococcoidia bacterium]